MQIIKFPVKSYTRLWRKYRQHFWALTWTSSVVSKLPQLSLTQLCGDRRGCPGREGGRRGFLQYCNEFLNITMNFSFLWGSGSLSFKTHLYRRDDKKKKNLFLAGSVLDCASSYVNSYRNGKSVSELITILWISQHWDFSVFSQFCPVGTRSLGHQKGTFCLLSCLFRWQTGST